MSQSFDDPLGDRSKSVRQLPRNTVRTEEPSFIRKHALGISAGAAIAVASVVALAPKFSRLISELDTQNLPPVEKTAVELEKPSYLEKVQQHGLLVVHASGSSLINIIGEIQSVISPGDREKAVDTISLYEKNGFYLATLKSGVELRPITHASMQGAGVSIAFLKPTDEEVLNRLKANYLTVEIKPEDLLNKDVLDLKGYLAKAGGTVPSSEAIQERQLAGAAVEVRLKNIYSEPTSEENNKFSTERREVISFLRENIGETTFSSQVAVRGTHSTIAKKITGEDSLETNQLANILESRAPKIIADNEFTIDITPVFEDGKDLVIYFGSSADSERFKARFVPQK